MMKMKNLIIVIFLSVVSFGVFAQEVITASAISLNEAIENLKNKAKEKNSTIVKITSAGGKNYVKSKCYHSEKLIINFVCLLFTLRFLVSSIIEDTIF